MGGNRHQSDLQAAHIRMTGEIISLVVAVIASSGLWTFLTRVYDSRKKKLSNSEKISLGVAHDRIMYLGGLYIKRGYISPDEYENLHDFLYIPYRDMGGNGAAERIMREIDKLPIRKDGE